MTEIMAAGSPDSLPGSKNSDGPVVLVSRDIAFTFPLAYGYLAGYLKQQGEDVRMLFKGSDHELLARQIMEMKPLLVGFGSLYPELKEIARIIDLLNSSGRDFPVVIGGQMVTPIPEFAVQVTGADFGVIGEGEITLYELVKSLREGRDVSAIRGLVINEGGRCLNTGPGEFIEDLSLLPPIPYELFPEDKWLPIGIWYAKNFPQPHWRIEDRVINVHGGRGCPFRCNFCYHHSKPRYRPVDLMIAEAAESLERFQGNMLYFSDDLVLSSPGRARLLVEELGKLGRPVEYSLSCRFDILARMDDGLLGDMKKTGCRIMGLGIESGSDRILEIIGKNCTVDMIRDGLDRLKRHDILPTVSIMMGQDTETREDAEASIRLMKEIVDANPRVNFAFTVTTPFPGSPLYSAIMKRGYLRDHRDFYDRYFDAPGEFKMIVNMTTMNDDEMQEMFVRINREYIEEKARRPLVRLTAVAIDGESFRSAYGVPFVIDMMMLDENGSVLFRCVSGDARPSGFLDFFTDRLKACLLDMVAAVFPEAHGHYARCANLFVSEFSRADLERLTDGRNAGWFVLHGNPSFAGTGAQ